MFIEICFVINILMKSMQLFLPVIKTFLLYQISVIESVRFKVIDVRTQPVPQVTQSF